MVNILVTGANRGIGYAIVQALSTHQPSSNIILACRSQSSAQEAIRTLRNENFSGLLDYVELDIENDASIQGAVTTIGAKFGSLDILINNAAKIEPPKSTSLADIRSASNACYNNMITSNVIVTRAFSLLLRKSPWPRVIMVSSARASMSRTANGDLPPAVNIDYCIAKAGLNMMTLQLQAAENSTGKASNITYWAVSPGHCKTAFNGYRGKKDPLEGAEPIIRLLETEREEVSGGTFWEYENGEFKQVPW
ncbi:hypothetical protein AK830_g10655 [Neonectria ditissima]|uniref:Uncharacterized protein n=1 Tax=Neonectria ditissima TaxID=78410 RepID=A0A0P7BA15_9HYPO|nr:hypothetical protein AK830_g10655 [Neonectria ditissima]